ncbi:MAG TPA: GNAT family N-acetyltransferase [Beutenbergiaceae bacterium]|nr:GNAT family N-acetyltransferase [Beutenbergiaceae bacterium]
MSDLKGHLLRAAGVQARLAEIDDLDAVLPVLRSARADSPLGAQLVNPDSYDLVCHLRAWFGQPDSRLVIAQAEDRVVGIALAQIIDENLFSDVVYLQLEALFVDPDFRRRGTGRSLMAQLAVVAARAGAEQVVTTPVSGARSEQRFLSGLGFSVVGARRMVETAALLRRLELQSAGRERRGRGLDELIARRRRSRGLPPTPPNGMSLAQLADRTEDVVTEVRPQRRWRASSGA